MILTSGNKILLAREELEDFSVRSYRCGEAVWKDKEGHLHREDGPACIGRDGQTWYKHGVFHREGGLPAVINPTWTGWFIDGLYHREDGPAYVSDNGTKSWFLNGKAVTEATVRALGKMK